MIERADLLRIAESISDTLDAGNITFPIWKAVQGDIVFFQRISGGGEIHMFDGVRWVRGARTIADQEEGE